MSSRDTSTILKDKNRNPLILFNAEEDGKEISNILKLDQSSFTNEDKNIKFRIDL